MAKVFFGFTLADSMFSGNCDISRRQLTVDEAKIQVEQGVEPCLNPSHKATIDAMRTRFGIDVPIPENPPQVSVSVGDAIIVIIVMGIRGLQRLTDRHEYTVEEIALATFTLAMYAVAG